MTQASPILSADPSRTSVTCVGGGMIDLLNPRVADVSLPAIAEHLAKINRYCGATKGVVYSVAEHSARCAAAALVVTGDRLLAAYLLCHDMHEAYLGDDVTPKKRTLAAIVATFGVLSEPVERAFAQLTDRLDRAIHSRAGLAWPMPDGMAEKVHHWDRRLLATEWRDLMCCPPPFDFGVLPLGSTIEPVEDWRKGRDLMLSGYAELLPNRISEAS
jgi:uncharacterized protein